MKIFKNVLLFWAIFSFIQTATAQGQSWDIPKFNSDITINQSGKVDVTETIVADFTNEPSHGIYRIIPYEYVDENNKVSYTVDLNFISAQNEKGSSYGIQKTNENGYLNVRLGDADVMLNALTTYVLKYDAMGVIGFFDEAKAKQENTFPHDEFFWNVNGTEWEVPMMEVTATVHLPKSFNESDLKFGCITGIYGATENDCEYKLIDGQTVEFKATRPLAATENLSILIGMPVGTIAPPPPPSMMQSTALLIFGLIAIFGGLIFPIITLIVMIILWYKYGRDDQSVPDTIMPIYEVPDKLTPTEAGVIIDENLDPQDITATIVDFAVRGYIKINELEEDGILWGKNYDYELELIKPYENVKEFEKKILHGIFSENKVGEKKKISKLKNTFYTNLDGIQKETMNEVVTGGYFPKDPSSVRMKYGAIGGFACFAGFFLGGAILPSLWIGFVLSGIIIIFIGRKMPHRTTKGTETLYKLKGLHEYINTAEVDRMKFQEKNNILFEKLLPYAMAFGLIEKWSKAFDGLIKNPPNWYNSRRPWDNGFTMLYFADRLSHISNDLSTNMASRPGSKGGHGSWGGGSGFSGGGFSGGGFGGGGGGRW